MAAVPIVTEVTKAQLDALVAADGLNEGLQYKVTDKNWLLIAISSNTLNSFNGILLIVNETIPPYINPDVIIIDTGNVIAETLGVPEITSSISIYVLSNHAPGYRAVLRYEKILI